MMVGVVKLRFEMFFRLLNKNSRVERFRVSGIVFCVMALSV